MYILSRCKDLNQFIDKNDKLWMAKFTNRTEQAKRHVRSCAIIYEQQRQVGRFFLHEHPWMASSWALDRMIKLEGYAGVRKIRADMCQFGMTTRIGGIGSE